MTAGQGSLEVRAQSGATAAAAAQWAAIGLAATFCASWFFGLTASSLWLDELYTAEFITRGKTVSGLMAYVFTDVHPPAYYLAALAWTDLVGFSDLKLRLFSTLCALATVGVLYLGTRGALKAWPRAFLAALAASSSVLSFYAQEARMYALVFLLLSVLLACGLASLRGFRQGRTPWRALAGVAAAAWLASLTHFYAFVLSGLAMLYLLAFARSRAARGFIVAAGLVVFLCELAFVLQLSRNATEIGGWFSPDLRWVWWNTRDFLTSVLLWWNGLAYFAVAAAVALALARHGKAMFARPDLADLGLAIFAGAGTYAVGVLVNLLAIPSFSTRNIFVTMPLLWFATAWLAQAVVDAADPRWRRWAPLALTATLVPNLAFLAWKDDPAREPWRSSAEYVAARPGCRASGAEVLSQAGFDEISAFGYGYYAPGVPVRVNRLIRADRQPEAGGPRIDAWVARAAAQAAAPAGCPVMLWTVHFADETQLRALTERLTADPRFPRDRRLVIRRFPYIDPLMQGQSFDRAFVVELAPKGAGN